MKAIQYNIGHHIIIHSINHSIQNFTFITYLYVSYVLFLSIQSGHINAS